MVSGVATYCMIVGLGIGLIITGFITHRIVKHRRAKRIMKQEQHLEQNNEREGDDPPIQQPDTSVQVDIHPAYELSTSGLSPPPKHIIKNS